MSKKFSIRKLKKMEDKAEKQYLTESQCAETLFSGILNTKELPLVIKVPVCAFVDTLWKKHKKQEYMEGRTTGRKIFIDQYSLQAFQEQTKYIRNPELYRRKLQKEKWMQLEAQRLLREQEERERQRGYASEDFDEEIVEREVKDLNLQ